MGSVVFRNLLVARIPDSGRFLIEGLWASRAWSATVSCSGIAGKSKLPYFEEIA